MRETLARRIRLIAGDKLSQEEIYKIADDAVAVMNEMNKAIAANVVALVKNTIKKAETESGEKDG